MTINYIEDFKSLKDLPTKQIKVQSLRYGHLMVLENGRVCDPDLGGGREGPTKRRDGYYLILPRDKTGNKRKRYFLKSGTLVTVVSVRSAIVRLPPRLMKKVHGSAEYHKANREQ